MVKTKIVLSVEYFLFNLSPPWLILEQIQNFPVHSFYGPKL